MLVRALIGGKTSLYCGCRRESNNQQHRQKIKRVGYQKKVEQAADVCLKAPKVAISTGARLGSLGPGDREEMTKMAVFIVLMFSGRAFKLTLVP